MGASMNGRRPGLAGCRGTRFNLQIQCGAHLTPKRNRQGGLALARKTRIDTRFWGSKLAILGLALCCSACASTLDSGWTPFQLALFSPLQTFPEEVDVRGLRTNLLYGDNADFRGVDLGMVGTANSTKGVQSNFFYNEAEDLSGRRFQ